MRIMTDEETKVFFTKLSEYLGENIKFLIDR
jgi:ribosome biogenesis protein Nip4